MNEELEVRTQALKLSINYHGRNSNIDDIFKTANVFSEYIISAKQNKPARKSTYMDFTREDILELSECMNSPVAFAAKCKIIQINGPVQFNLYPYQSDYLNFIHTNQRSLTVSARQMGTTTVTAAYVLWSALFKPDQTILLAAHQLVQAVEILDRIRYMFEKLPDLYKVGVVQYNKGLVEFENGSRIIARAASSDMGRGLSFNMLVLDQPAYISHKRGWEMMEALMPVMAASNAKIIMHSTAGVTDGFFYKYWVDSLTSKSSYANMTLPWNLHPNRDAAWRDEMIKTLGQEQFDQEFECKFKSV